MKKILMAILIGTLVACGGGGGNSSAPPLVNVPVVSPTTTTTVASILVTPSSRTLIADGTSSVVFTVRALDSSNGLVLGAKVDLSASTGVILSKSAVTTDTTSGIGTVTMIADFANQISRIATVTASCASCSAAPVVNSISITGASLALSSPNGGGLVVGGAASTLSATVKDTSGALMPGVDVSFSSTDPLVLGVSAPIKTNASGVASVTVTGLASGSATINVVALGNAKATQAYSVGVSTGVLSITSPTNNASMVTQQAQTIVASVPGSATSATFTSTLGTFGNGQTSQVVNVVGGSASASLTVPQAGTATISVVDSLSRTVVLNLKVSPPVTSTNKILLSASQTTVAVSTGTSTPSVRLKVQAIYSVGASDQAVANVPIAFTMTGGPGGGEYLSTALQYTDSSGYAYADFYSGTSSSIANGISIGASYQGSLIQTGIPQSSNNALLTIGGQALSVAFGQASVLRESSDKTLYMQDYSVQVTDANNNPVAGAAVTLRMRPVAFSTGTACTVQATYCSEDVNGNGSLDTNEDGKRVLLSSATAAGVCNTITAPAATIGTSDQTLTPQNSAGGSVPSIVTTLADGTVGFTLTYLKGSALWIVNKLTATVSPNGTESSSSIIFRLPASVPDTTAPCALPSSPYVY